ncbi:hypothetical protein U1Q18_028099, partial [Sarracenia purpurea var. burkii]
MTGEGVPQSLEPSGDGGGSPTENNLEGDIETLSVQTPPPPVPSEEANRKSSMSPALSASATESDEDDEEEEKRRSSPSKVESSNQSVSSGSAIDGHKGSIVKDVTELEINPKKFMSGPAVLLQEESDVITPVNECGTKEASGSELKLGCPELSEVIEQENTGDRGDKVTFSPIDNNHNGLISGDNCCVDVVSNENPHPGFAEGKGNVVSEGGYGAEGLIDNVKIRGNMVFSSKEKKSDTEQVISMIQDSMAQAEAAASLPKPKAVATLPRSWAHVAASNRNPGLYTEE